MKNKITIKVKRNSGIGLNYGVDDFGLLLYCDVYINGKCTQSDVLWYEHEIKDFVEIARTPSLVVLYLKKYKSQGGTIILNIFKKILKGYELEVDPGDMWHRAGMLLGDL